jgi:hypothetical protein
VLIDQFGELDLEPFDLPGELGCDGDHRGDVRTHGGLELAGSTELVGA